MIVHTSLGDAQLLKAVVVVRTGRLRVSGLSTEQALSFGIGGESRSVKRVSSSSCPARANLALKIRDKDIGKDTVAGRVGQNWVGIELSGDLVWVVEVTGVENGLGADMGHVVVLSDEIMKGLDTSKSIFILVLGCKMTENKHGGLVGPDEDGADKKLEIVSPVVVVRVRCIKIENDKIGIVGKMMCGAKCKIRRVGATKGAYGQFGRGMGEYSVPPVEETRRIARRGDWIFACTVACRYYSASAKISAKKDK